MLNVIHNTWVLAVVQIDLVKGMMDCLYAECTPCITDCVMAELEKLGQKYRVALKVAKVSACSDAQVHYVIQTAGLAGLLRGIVAVVTCFVFTYCNTTGCLVRAFDRCA